MYPVVALFVAVKKEAQSEEIPKPDYMQRRRPEQGSAIQRDKFALLK